MSSQAVLIYSPGARENYGHAWDYSTGLADGFAELGYRPIVVCHPGPRSPDGSHHFSSYRTRRLSWRLLSGPLARQLRRLLVERRLISHLRWLLERDAGALVVFETFEYLTLSRHLPSLKGGGRAAIFHSTKFRSESTGLVRRLYKHLSWRRARFIALTVEQAFAHGPNMVRALQSDLQVPEGVFLPLQHGAPRPRQGALLDRTGARLTLDLDPDFHYILSFGTVRADKDYESLFGGVATLREWRVLVAGPEGDMAFQDLERMVVDLGMQDKVVFRRGFIAAAQHPVYFAAADVVAALYKPGTNHESGTAKRVRSFGRPILCAGMPDLMDYCDEYAVGIGCESDGASVATALLSLQERTPEQIEDWERHILEVAEDLSWRNSALTILSGIRDASETRRSC